MLFRSLTKAGGDTWFFLSADYAFGAALERDTTAVVNANGGKVLGGIKHPLNTSDFSSFLLQAQNSKAKVIGLAATPPTPSSRLPSSESPRLARSLPHCCLPSTTCTAWA